MHPSVAGEIPGACLSMMRTQRTRPVMRSESPGRSLQGAAASMLHRAEAELRSLRQAMNRIESELAGTRIRESEARHLAMHDALTGLPNLRLFRQRLEEALGHGVLPPRPLALLYIDLNGFKAVNDTCGHAAGDQLLKIVAGRLRHSMRAEDLVCRLGGDEFACLLVGLADRRQISRVAIKVFRVLGEPMRVGDTRLTISAGIGIALSPAHGTTADSLVQYADTAMYHAKKGQARYVFFRKRIAADDHPGCAPAGESWPVSAIHAAGTGRRRTVQSGR